MSTFLTWPEAYHRGPSVCGGKGYNLARLARYGFRVPRGGVLPAGAPLSAIPRGVARLGLFDAKVAVGSRSPANSKEEAPGVLCELSRSSLCEVVGHASYAAPKAAGYQMPAGTEVVRRFQGRGFFDLTMMQWAFYDAFGHMPADTIRELGGCQPEIQVPANSPLKGHEGRRRQLAGLRLLRQIWNFPAKARAAIERQMAYQRALGAVDWRAFSREELRSAMTRINLVQHSFLPAFGLANGSSGPWQMALDSLVKDADLIGRLQAGGGEVVSAEQGYRLYEIAQGKSTIEEFLHDFGHRAVYEADLLNPRWAEDPSWILEQVESIRENP